MKFKIDENLPVEVANLLTEQGHDALTVFQEHLDGAPDSYILLPNAPLEHHLWIVEEKRVRISGRERKAYEEG